MTHLGYIVSAYLATAIVLVGMILWVAGDLSAQKRKLDALEDARSRRRSEVPR